MNTLEFFMLLGLVGVIAYVAGYWYGRDRTEDRYEATIDEWEKEWKGTLDKAMDARDDMAVQLGFRNEALRFYSDVGNWMKGEISKDGGDVARKAIGDLRVVGKVA